jgi:hypothetical protein
MNILAHLKLGLIWTAFDNVLVQIRTTLSAL